MPTGRGNGKGCPVTGFVSRKLYEGQSKPGWITLVVFGANIFAEASLRLDEMGRLTPSKSQEANQEMRHLLSLGR